MNLNEFPRQTHLLGRSKKIGLNISEFRNVIKSRRYEIEIDDRLGKCLGLGVIDAF